MRRRAVFQPLTELGVGWYKHNPLRCQRNGLFLITNYRSRRAIPIQVLGRRVSSSLTFISHQGIS